MNNEKLCISAIRCTGSDMINKASSGHPGIVLGSAPIVHTLFTRHLRVNPKNDKWFNRDRFVLSAGHGSALLYTMLNFSGFKLSIEDLKQFRQFGSLTPGHPEFKHTEGVDFTTGPLGQGISGAVGMAIAEKHLASKFNKSGNTIVDHNTYVLCGDGDLEEGVTYEACSLAGTLELNKLIVLFASNDIQLDGEVKEVFVENVKSRFESMNWNHILVKDAEDIDAIDSAIKEAKLSKNKPTIIEVKTTIGFGARNAGTRSVHGSPIGESGSDYLRNSLMYDAKPFEIPEEVYAFYKENVVDKGEALNLKWNEAVKTYKEDFKKDGELFEATILNEYDFDYDILPKYEVGEKVATRAIVGKMLDKISAEIPTLIGGSADLSSSTKVQGADGVFSAQNYNGRNIKFGVREHAMGAIVNGITAHGGLRGFGSGFFVFSDYLKPSIRLSSLMNIPATFIFSHDSIMVGEDGPTHEPIEQLTMLRAIPNLNVIRPCDANECAGALHQAFTSKGTPTVIVTTRQALATLSTSKISGVEKGAYIVYKEKGLLEGILLATGSEVELAVAAAEKLEESGKHVRVVSMPSMFNFDKQSSSYKEEILPSSVDNRLAIEMGSPLSFYKYSRKVLGIEKFGMSSPANLLVSEYGFTVENVINMYLNK